MPKNGCLEWTTTTTDQQRAPAQALRTHRRTSEVIRTLINVLSAAIASRWLADLIRHSAATERHALKPSPDVEDPDSAH